SSSNRKKCSTPASYRSSMHLFFATGVPRFTSNRCRTQPSGTVTGLGDPSSTTTLTAPSGSLPSISCMVRLSISGRLNVVIATPIRGISPGLENHGDENDDSGKYRIPLITTSWNSTFSPPDTDPLSNNVSNTTTSTATTLGVGS